MKVIAAIVAIALTIAIAITGLAPTHANENHPAREYSMQAVAHGNWALKTEDGDVWGVNAENLIDGASYTAVFNDNGTDEIEDDALVCWKKN